MGPPAAGRQGLRRAADETALVLAAATAPDPFVALRSSPSLPNFVRSRKGEGRRPPACTPAHSSAFGCSCGSRSPGRALATGVGTTASLHQRRPERWPRCGSASVGASIGAQRCACCSFTTAGAKPGAIGGQRTPAHRRHPSVRDADWITPAHAWRSPRARLTVVPRPQRAPQARVPGRSQPRDSAPTMPVVRRARDRGERAVEALSTASRCVGA